MTSSRSHLWRLATACSLLGLSCGTQYADPITQGPSVDPCLAWTTAAECESDEVHGCTVQPNRVGCPATDSSCLAFTCQGGDPFVHRSGQVLRLHDEPYRFVGVNSWGIAWDPTGCRISEFADQDAALARVFDDLVTMHSTVARIWAFQPYAGPAGTDYSRFDNVVRNARRANVRLIFVLENGLKDNCSKGNDRDDAWFTDGYQSPYDENTLSYPAYVTGLVKYFANEPTILGWELMHEAGATDFAALDGFVRDMSGLIRNNDPNHLISVGVNGGSDDTATSRSDGPPSSYYRLHDHATVDWLDTHNFMTIAGAAQAYPDSPNTARSIAESLNKPIFFGALAITVPDDSATSLKQRALRMKTQLDSAFSKGFVGTLVYDYYPDWSTTDPTTSFDSRPTDPLGGANGVLANAAARWGLP